MATRAANKKFTENGLLVVAPATLANGDQSAAADLGVRRPEVTWQVSGTPGVGMSIQLEKSNDGANWVILGTALTAAGMAEATSAARFMRFNVTAGDGTTALTAVLIAHSLRG